MTMEETPLPAEQAQSDGKADISPTSAVGLDSDVARIIRAEVIAAMNHQNRTKSSNDLPSYESSIRQHPNVALDEEGEPIIIRAKAKPLRESCMDHIRGTLGLLAIVIIFTLWMFLMATGLDPMRFSLLALFLLLSVCVFTGLFLYLVANDNGQTQPQNHPDSLKWEGIKVIYAVLLLYLMFYGIILAWSVMLSEAPSSMYPHYRASKSLQSKVDIDNVTQKLAWCLQGTVSGQNATVEDFVGCLKKMGMKKFPGDTTWVRPWLAEPGFG